MHIKPLIFKNFSFINLSSFIFSFVFSFRVPSPAIDVTNYNKISDFATGKSLQF